MFEIQRLCYHSYSRSAQQNLSLSLYFIKKRYEKASLDFCLNSEVFGVRLRPKKKEKFSDDGINFR